MSVVVVTGAGSGIGLATSAHLARKGHTVYAGARSDAPELAEVAERESLAIHRVELDVDSDASVRGALDRVEKEAGRIDVLVNNAGVAASGAIEDMPLESVKALFETNYFGAIRMIQGVLPGMRERGQGAIVNVSSISGLVAFAAQGQYAASKFALEAASEALAQEVASFGIRVLLIEPGIVLTPIYGKAAYHTNASSPYAVHAGRGVQYFQKQMPGASKPDDVALAIEEALSSESPKLRHIVGTDAALLAAGRRRTSDEDHIAAGLPMPDEAYLELLNKRFGFDW